nr:MAG TPA: hypothetical protein [Caudoviricetes sp.]
MISLVLFSLVFIVNSPFSIQFYLRCAATLYFPFRLVTDNGYINRGKAPLFYINIETTGASNMIIAVSGVVNLFHSVIPPYNQQFAGAVADTDNIIKKNSVPIGIGNTHLFIACIQCYHNFTSFQFNP